MKWIRIYHGLAFFSFFFFCHFSFSKACSGARLVKRLPWKHEDLSSVSKTHIQKARQVVVQAFNPVPNRWSRGIPGVPCPANLDFLTDSTPARDPVSRNRMGSSWGMPVKVAYGLHRHPHTHHKTKQKTVQHVFHSVYVFLERISMSRGK